MQRILGVLKNIKMCIQKNTVMNFRFARNIESKNTFL